MLSLQGIMQEISRHLRQPEAGWKKEENGAELDKTTREQTRKMLKQSWGVTDRASADEALEELLDSQKTVALPGITAVWSLIWILLSGRLLYRKRSTG